MNCYLIQFSGEIGLKGRRTRNRFVDRLVHNLADALRSQGLEYKLDRRWSQVRLESPSTLAGEVARRVFGVRSVARATKIQWRDLDHLVTVGAELFTPRIRGKTFAVRARRGEQAFSIPFKSPELERALGAALLDSSAGVDLKHPEVMVHVHLHGDQAFFFDRVERGEGGLPLGAEGRALTLFSGGFDSPVAAWSLLKRGVRQDFIFFNLAGDRHVMQVTRVLKALVDRWCFGYRPRLFIVDFRPVVEQLKASTPSSFWQVLLKRLMLRAADELAEFLQAPALITGDAVAQVSSQTLHNLQVVSRGIRRPVLRPLVSLDKEDIIARARSVGTHDLSVQVPEYCGLEGDSGPATHAPEDQVIEAEAALDSERLHRALERRAFIDLRAMSLSALDDRDLSVSAVPDGAGLVDLRSARAFGAWHPEGAVHWAYPDVLRQLDSFEPDTTYVAYCELGIKSAHLAEALTARGIRAFHLEKGVQTLRRAETEADPALEALMSPALRDGS